MIAETKISWDELTERGRIASEKLDTGRWEIGDLACEVAKDYGTDQMELFAREIGQKKETVKGYKRVARTFPKSVRAKLFEEYPNLFYSHYRTAARLESPKEQIEFLEESSLNNWTTDQCEYEMSKRLGKPGRTATGQQPDNPATDKSYYAIVYRLEQVDSGAPLMTLQFPRGVDDFKMGANVRITITPIDKTTIFD